MVRRRLLAIFGALGLLAGLISSGVAAQASTPGPDATYSAMLATYLWSSQDVCYSNGVAPVSTSPCVITQPTPAPGHRNIAVCAQTSTPAAGQQCDITQTNDTNNNYALVIQRINQQGATASCIAVPCQGATQRASIQQTDGTGSNFGGIIQQVTQSLTEQATDDDPGQINHQDVRSLTTGLPGLKQSSGVGTTGAGSNFAAVGQFSQQSQTGSTAQTQDARQFAGSTESGLGINQTTRTPAGNAAVLGQVQKQDLQSPVAVTQSQGAGQDGDITQDDGTGTQNFASGNQFQDQREQGISTTFQSQFGDPRCCSPQTSGGNFYVTIHTNQLANNIAPADPARNHRGQLRLYPQRNLPHVAQRHSAGCDNNGIPMSNTILLP